MNNTYYFLTKVTPLNKLTKHDMDRVARAANIAETSIFNSSKRLGAYLEHKKSYFYMEKISIVAET